MLLHRPVAESPLSRGRQPRPSNSDSSARSRAPDRGRDAELADRLEREHAETAAIAARLPRGVFFGTSTWSFPGWAGIVYSRRATTAELAREGLAEYARHPLLTTVGIDRGYYGPIPARTSSATPRSSRRGFPCCAKAPEAVTAAVRDRRAAAPTPTTSGRSGSSTRWSGRSSSLFGNTRARSSSSFRRPRRRSGAAGLRREARPLSRGASGRSAVCRGAARRGAPDAGVSRRARGARRGARLQLRDRDADAGRRRLPPFPSRRRRLP